MSAEQADSIAKIITHRGQPLRAAIEGLSPACPITEQLADSANHHADRTVELRTLRKAKESLAYAVARDSDLLQVASPVQEDLIRLLAYRDPVIFQLESLEIAHAREFRNDVRLAMQLAAQRRHEVEELALPDLPNYLCTDKKCEAYLRRWQEDRELGCAACGARSAYFLIERGVHECEDCRHQRSLREDTLFSGSHIRLTTWFSAIQVVLQHPDVTTNALAKHLRISRSDTVRGVRSRIQRAMNSDNCTTLLAGLDAEFEFLQPVPNAPHSALRSTPELGGLGRT